MYMFGEYVLDGACHPLKCFSSVIMGSNQRPRLSSDLAVRSSHPTSRCSYNRSAMELTRNGHPLV